MTRILAALAFCLALIAGSDEARAQGTVIPHTCSQAYQTTVTTSATTTALLGPGSVTSPTTGAQVLQNSANGILICGYTINAQTATAAAQLEYGTGASCTSPVALTPVWTFSSTAGGFLTDNADYFRGLGVPPGFTLCLVTSGSSPTVGIIVYYNNLAP